MTPAEHDLLTTFRFLDGPEPLHQAVALLNSLPTGWAILRLFTSRNPWSQRNRELEKSADVLAGRGMLTLTRARRLKLMCEYEITEAGCAALEAAWPSTTNGAS